MAEEEPPTHTETMTSTNDSNNVLHVAVGSSNPCKIKAVQTAFEDTFSGTSIVEIVISSHNVSSGVSDQPMGDSETKLGAKNRAEAAYQNAMDDFHHGKKVTIVATSSFHGSVRDETSIEYNCYNGPPDFSVGLEGGVEESDGILWCMAWMSIIGTDSTKCQLCRSETPASPTTTNSKKDESIVQNTKVWSFGRTGSFPLPPKVAELVLQSGMELGDADDFVFKRVNGKQGSGTVGILTKGMIDRSNYYDHAIKLALIPWMRPELYITHNSK